LNAGEYERMQRVEDRHWWYNGMETITRAILDRWLPTNEKLKILDAGCGTGAAMQSILCHYGEVTGLDISSEAMKYWCGRSVTVACATVGAIPFAPDSFHLVTSFDVLYAATVPSVESALEEFARVLKPGGRLLLRLPAYDWLRGQHDLAVGTARRFTEAGIANFLQAAGFKVLFRSYANMWLFPLAAIKRAIDYHFPTEWAMDLSLPPAFINQLLTRILKSEACSVAQRGLPFGLSIYVVGQKPC
jgi:SAM-dependent methyltransferase